MAVRKDNSSQECCKNCSKKANKATEKCRKNGRWQKAYRRANRLKRARDGDGRKIKFIDTTNQSTKMSGRGKGKEQPKEVASAPAVDTEDKENQHPVTSPRAKKEAKKRAAARRVQTVMAAEHSDDDDVKVVEERGEEMADGGDSEVSDEENDESSGDEKSSNVAVAEGKVEKGEEKDEVTAHGAIQALRNRLAELPKTMFGIQLASGGSASMANQIVIHTEIQELAKEIVRFLENNESAASQVKAIHDMLHTSVTSQKKGLAAWQQTIASSLDDWKKCLKKEQEGKMLAQDGDIKMMKGMLQQLLSDKIEVAETTENGTRKRKSDLSDDQTVPKMAKPEAEPSPSDRYKAATALAKERRQKMKFACVLCVMHDHQTAECEAYQGTAARRLRMADLGICTTCGRNHVGKCKFEHSKQCILCGDLHLKYLCPKTFD